MERVLHELKGLLLNIGKARLLKVAHHVRRHPENPGNLIDLELPSLQKLCLLR